MSPLTACEDQTVPKLDHHSTIDEGVTGGELRVAASSPKTLSSLHL
jgi:hypothetical protein